ncbi:thioredoxin-disulfide reductase [Candidatus Contubernalis alkaliaceticus]|uniref:thioredoxin-disulfide reductase n=1 Tax=Candidatus Contubernalis alkaliaceticus TaxID=338645 RepID=UPI001F4C3549|nr:thioredoxin-disulfide reductase [Candidatus Contubernalis alkalaceticus]
MNQEIWDALIIGGGPGGLAAGIYCGRSKLETLMLEKGSLGGQVVEYEELENYPGFRRGSKGTEVVGSMAEHAKDFGLQIEKEEVIKIELEDNLKVAVTKSGKKYYAKTVILALGAKPRFLGAKGEKELTGKGVSYCATCDASFFEELEVMVIGNGDKAIEEAMYLTKFAEKVTIVIRRGMTEIGANKVSVEKALANPKISWICHSTVEEIKGDGIVETLVLRNLKDGGLSEHTTDGVFVFIGIEPKTSFLSDLIELDSHGWIVTDDKMETSVEGIYAVGDVRNKYLRQVVTAVSDGAIAAVAAEKYMEEQEDFRERVLNSQKPVAVGFWSMDKKESAVVLEEVEKIVNETEGSVTITKIEVSKKQELASRYDVKEVPTVLFFEKGQVINRLSGSFSMEDVRSILKNF